MCNIARATVECIPKVHSPELLDMRYAPIALLAALATTLLPLATAAVAELGHPTGCFMCSPVEVAAAPPGATGASARDDGHRDGKYPTRKDSPAPR